MGRSQIAIICFDHLNNVKHNYACSSFSTTPRGQDICLKTYSYVFLNTVMEKNSPVSICWWNCKKINISHLRLMIFFLLNEVSFQILYHALGHNFYKLFFNRITQACINSHVLPQTSWPKIEAKKKKNKTPELPTLQVNVFKFDFNHCRCHFHIYCTVLRETVILLLTRYTISTLEQVYYCQTHWVNFAV